MKFLLEGEISDEKCQVIFLGFDIQNFNNNSSKWFWRFSIAKS
jgi:hypothetical protein